MFDDRLFYHQNTTLIVGLMGFRGFSRKLGSNKDAILGSEIKFCN